ncbi:MAG: carbohydrate kinase family protein [Bradymonadia bacterium]
MTTGPSDQTAPLPEIFILGDALVDFVPLHYGALSTATTFEMHSGGAPGNVAVVSARLGGRSGFAGVVGDDAFGLFLKANFERERVDTRCLRLTHEDITGLCFITLDDNRERSFTHRGGDAAALLNAEDVDPTFAAAAKVCFFSVSSLRKAGGEAAVEALIEHATGLVCCDPGKAPPSWGDPAMIEARLQRMLSRCDVIKCAEDETEWLTGVRFHEEAAQRLLERGATLAVVTLGPEGAYWARANDSGYVQTPRVQVVDTTGAGDAFMAALLVRLSQESGPLAEVPQARIQDHLNFACEIGAYAVTRRGAVVGIPRMPSIIGGPGPEGR